MEADNTDGDLRWKKYSYPPCCRLFYYSLEDLQEPMKSLARKMHAAALLVLIIQPVQLINCFMQVGSKCGLIHKYYIVYALCNALIWPSLAFFIFSRGFTAICQGPNHSKALVTFYGATAVALFFYAFFIFSGNGAANGIVKMS